MWPLRAAQPLQPDGVDFNYTDASCQPIANVIDAAVGNALGVVNSKVIVDGTVQNFHGHPYLQRHYDIVPSSNGAVTVKLSATQAEFDAFPNPVKNVLTVRVNGVIGANATVNIMDVSGRVINQFAVNTQSFEMRVNELAAGIYLLQYEDDNQHQTIRFTKE